MLNTLCRCFYFWQENESDDESAAALDRTSSLQRPDVCLDITRSGKKNYFNVCFHLTIDYNKSS